VTGAPCDHRAVNASTDPLPPAGLVRRLAALLYDALLIFALMLVATALFLPLTGGEALRWQATPALFVVHKFVVVGVLVAFYGLFWTRLGQTLGMLCWRLQLSRLDGTRVDWADTARRLAAATLSWAALGLGWLWCVVDRDRRTWHDRLSRTQVRVLPKRSRTQPPAAA
jgi:uncharacterized RDD family membrane protein YckC